MTFFSFCLETCLEELSQNLVEFQWFFLLDPVTGTLDVLNGAVFNVQGRQLCQLCLECCVLCAPDDHSLCRNPQKWTGSSVGEEEPLTFLQTILFLYRLVPFVVACSHRARRP